MPAKKIKYLSLCSGIEAVTVAWKDLAFEPVAFAEIEKFPCEVLQHHYPNIPNLGDMTKINGEQYCGTVDLLVGGTPCQSYSVAGNRGGLADPRGQLALQFVKLIHEVKPTWVLWENVPGVFSTNKGRDFATFCSSLDEIGYHLAWRVLDAQHFGVPQRRRRVFLVGHATDWRASAKVLFEPESLRGNIEAGERAKQDTSGRTTDCFREGSFGTFIARDKGGTLKRSGGPLGGGSENLVLCEPRKRASCLVLDEGGQYSRIDNDLRPTLRSNCGGAVPSVYEHHQQDARIKEVTLCPALNASWDNCSSLPLVYENHGQDCRVKECAISPTTVTSKYGTGGGNVPLRVEQKAVRRLTPIECERLQGFPDNYTRISWRGKPAEECPDSHRYKALGNSMAVPVVRWIGKRIMSVHNGLNIS